MKRTSQWLNESRENLRQRPFPCLVLHFFHRFFDSEMAAGDNDNSLSIGAIFALLAVPGMLMPLFLFDKYSTLRLFLLHQPRFNVYLAAVPDRFFFVNFAMAVTGIVTVLKWDSLFPDRRDFANLAILPISMSRILYAKVLALSILMFLFALDLNGASTIVFPVVVTAAEYDISGFVGLVASHGVSVVLATGFTFFFFLAAIGLLMNLLPWQWFRQVSRYVRVASIVCLLVVFFSSFAVAPQLNHLAGDSPLRLLPPVWFTGLGQQLMNRGGSPALLALSVTAWRASLIALLCAALSYLLSYRRYFLRIPESLDLPAGSAIRGESRLLDLLDRILPQNSFERACTHFTLKTVFRSEKHTLFLGAYMGLGFTLAGEALLAGLNAPPEKLPSASLLEVPLILAFFLLSGLRFTFDLPAELRANWMFQIAGTANEESSRKTARNVMLLFALTPLLLVGLPAAVWLFGFEYGLMHTAFVAFVCVLFTRVLVFAYRKIPFTCARLPGKRNPAAGFAAFCAAFFAFVSLMTDLDRWILARPWRFLAGIAVTAILWRAAKSYLNGHIAPRETVIFEEEREPAVRTLSIA